MNKSTVTMVCLLFCQLVRAGTVINVPVDIATIQEALSSAADGDTVLVAPGSYFEREIRFFGKEVLLISSGGRDVTFIDGSNVAPVFKFIIPVGRKGIVDGFTIQNGLANDSFEGGGIWITAGSGPTIRNNIIQNNHNTLIDGSGGGIKVSPGSSALITGNIFRNNSAFATGGGIRARDSAVEITNNTFTNNVAMGDNEANGGAISLSLISSSLVDNNIFTDNTAGSVAGAISAYDANATISNNVFTGNTAPDFGGAVRLEDEVNSGPITVTVEGNEFTNNSTNHRGGAITAFFEVGDAMSMTGGSTYNILNNSFTGNSASNVGCTSDLDPDCANGGAIHVVRNNLAAGKLLVRGNLFDSNTADVFGAALFNKADVIFEDNTVRNNSTLFRYPGVSCAHAGLMPCVIRRNIFISNFATNTDGSTRNAGGAYLTGTAGLVENNWFFGNSGDRAGAVYYINTAGGTAIFSNNSFVNNVTVFAGGASLYIKGDADLFNNIFVGDNRGVRRDSASQLITLENNNFFNNTVALVRLGDSTTELPTIGEVNAQSFASGNTNIDPRFVNLGAQDLHLDSTSPLIDSISCINAPADDIDKEDRPQGVSCDVGADEFSIDDTIFLNGFELPNVVRE